MGQIKKRAARLKKPGSGMKMKKVVSIVAETHETKALNKVILSQKRADSNTGTANTGQGRAVGGSCFVS